MHKPLRTIVSAAVLGVLASSAAHATGFALYGEGTGYTAGNYGAGVAAEAADASTGWYNPAGLALLHEKQAVFGGTGIFPDVKINGTSTFHTTDIAKDYIEPFKNVNGSYSGFVPASHYALPVGDRTTLGLSITAPFGLSTDWAPDSPVRYSATYTELLTVNISPEIGTQLFDHFALGAGMDFQYSRVKFNQMIGVPTVLQAYLEDPMMGDTFSRNKGASWGLGFHVGVMGLFNDNHTRIGLNYQSKVRHVFYGNSELKGPLANTFNLIVPPFPTTAVRKNGDLFSDPIEFPDVVTLSGYQDINDRLALLGSVVYTGWHVFQSIQLNNVPVPNFGGPPLIPVTQANVLSNVPQNYKDAWRVALGANYRVNTQWMLRVGTGYDQTPSNNTDRNTRLPDVDRWALAVGAHYQWKPNLGFDLGYTHLFSASQPSITSMQQLSASSTYAVTSRTGHFSADLVGGQVVWVIDKAEPAAPMK